MPFFAGDVKRYVIAPKFTWLKYGEHLPEKPKSADIFTGKRLLVRRLISRQFRVMAMIAEDDFVNKKDLYVIKITDAAYTELYILGILNSSLISQLITGGSTTAVKNDFSQVNLSDLRQLPIPAATAEEQAAVAALVEQVLTAKAADAAADTQALEAQIDALVAALYGVALPAAAAG